MIYITGDTHGHFERIEYFCQQVNTTREDILIILGDAGINYYGVRDIYKKQLLASLPITIFAIHGNHEQRPGTIGTYVEKKWNGGIVYYEEEYPNILFAKDGEIFDLDGKKTIVCGGAYSIDWWIRMMSGAPLWREDEQPLEEIKQYVEQQLDSVDWTVDVVLTHTAPLKDELVEVYQEGVDQSRIDKSTETWLKQIEKKLDYKKWYCGHYHAEKKIDKLEIMFEKINLFLGEN